MPSDDSQTGTRARSARGLLKIAAGLGLAVVAPAAAVGLAAVTFLRSARKFAKSGDPRDAEGLVTGYSDLTSADGGKKKP